jgi:hypothetical protein
LDDSLVPVPFEIRTHKALTKEVSHVGWKALAVLAAAILVGGAYVAGYVPERRVRIAAEAEAEALRTRLAASEARVRVGELLGRALTLKDVAIRQDYGRALELSSQFFDAVRTESPRSDVGPPDGLNEILSLRDRVTAALAKADPAVVDTLHDVELRLRRLLGYGLPAESAPG